jgi:hypothetical protein
MAVKVSSNDFYQGVLKIIWDATRKRGENGDRRRGTASGNKVGVERVL